MLWRNIMTETIIYRTKVSDFKLSALLLLALVLFLFLVYFPITEDPNMRLYSKLLGFSILMFFMSVFVTSSYEETAIDPLSGEITIFESNKLKTKTKMKIKLADINRCSLSKEGNRFYISLIMKQGKILTILNKKTYEQVKDEKEMNFCLSRILVLSEIAKNNHI
jgi:hypothetical protein